MDYFTNVSTNSTNKNIYDCKQIIIKLTKIKAFMHVRKPRVLTKLKKDVTVAVSKLKKAHAHIICIKMTVTY